jgi:ribosomal protein L11 methylase PrmA
MNSEKKLTAAQFDTIMNLFREIVLRTSRSQAQNVTDFLSEMDTKLVDYEEENGINTCNCPDCEKQRKNSKIDDMKKMNPIMKKELFEFSKKMKKVIENDLNDKNKDALYKKLKDDLKKRKPFEGDLNDLK